MLSDGWEEWIDSAGKTAEVFDPERDRLYETALCGHSCHVPEAGNMLADAALALADRLHKEYTK